MNYIKLQKQLFQLSKLSLYQSPRFHMSSKPEESEEKKLNSLHIQLDQIPEEHFQPQILNEKNILENGIPSHQEKKKSISKKVSGNYWQMWGGIKHALHEAWLGTKKTYQDYKFTKSLLKNKQIYTESYTAEELQRITRIKRDAFKLVPFSFFLLVPFAELLIPVYLLIL